ncbi:MAG TPA: TonB-dependent receptor [Polyangia bacterium]|nr:TonB-dependent receptor [Polyangia bacterium]
MRTRRWALAARLLSFLAVAGAATSAARAHEPDEEHAPDTAPSPLERVEAVYPPEARAAGVSGAVGLELAVDANGNVTDVKVTRPAGFGFDDAAVAAARQLKFRPATHDGKPIAATVVFEQRFTLRPRIVAETTAEGAAPPPMPEAVATPPPGPSYESTVTSRGPISAASSSSIRNLDFDLRPKSSPNDILRVVPGLLTAQHQGGGKADQLFLRGFDADHGTDVGIFIDGVPVNLPSHAHGQGYADLHFIIPEAIERIDVVKGPYDPRWGDFSTAGAVNLVTREKFDESSVQYTLGMFPTIPGRAVAQGRFVGIAAPKLPGWAGKLHPWVAFEAAYDQGPFHASEHLYRYNLFAKLSYDLGPRTLVGMFFQAYGSGWIGSGQIPEREVAAGRLSQFGSEDPSEGGLTERQMLTAFFKHHDGANEVEATAYLTRYRLSLWNDFTFFLHDPVDGDEIEQDDARVFGGAKLAWHFHRRWRGISFRTSLGAEARDDGIAVHSYHATSQLGTFRQRLDAYRNMTDDQLDLGAYAEEDVVFARWFRFVGALRADYFGFDVGGDQSGVRQFYVLSPKASAIFSPIRDLLDLYLNFGVGFHTNPAEIALDDGQERPLPNGQPGTYTAHAIPRIYGGELGARTHLFDRVDLAAAFWVSYLESETVFDADVGELVPSDATRRLGFDLEARVRILSWLFADFDLAQATATAVPDSGNGGAIALAPKLYMTGGLTAKHRSGVRGGLRFRYLGDRPAFDETSDEYLTYGRKTIDGMPNPNYAPDRVIAKGYFVVDLYGAYRWRFLEAQVAIQNLFDSDWREAQFGNRSCTRDEVSNPANPNYQAACGVTLAPDKRVGVADVHFTPGVPFNLQFTLKAYF